MPGHLVHVGASLKDFEVILKVCKGCFQRLTDWLRAVLIGCRSVTLPIGRIQGVLHAAVEAAFEVRPLMVPRWWLHGMAAAAWPAKSVPYFGAGGRGIVDR